MVTAAKCDIGSKSDDPCRGTAAYQATDWGYGPGSDELEVCENHAREAISAGVRVFGADGDEVGFDDDGEIVVLTQEDKARDHAMKSATRINGLYLAIKRALALVHRYRAECCARAEAWRQDRRIIACIEQVAAYRASIRAIRATVRVQAAR